MRGSKSWWRIEIKSLKEKEWLVCIIRLLKGEGRYQRKAFEENFSQGDTIFGDNCEPIELARWNIEDKEEAEATLAKYQCEYNYGELQNTYYVTEYGLEYCDCDEDGEWEAGSDFDLAEETTKK